MAEVSDAKLTEPNDQIPGHRGDKYEQCFNIFCIQYIIITIIIVTIFVVTAIIIELLRTGISLLFYPKVSEVLKKNGAGSIYL